MSLNIKYKYLVILIVALSIPLIFLNCGKKSSIDLGTKPVSIKQFNVPSGVDPEVPAEKGGKGFKGEGWNTNDKYNIIGKKDAVKGGKFTYPIPEFPASIRVFGINSNHEINDLISTLMYESLLNIDPIDKSFYPSLASHWKIAQDSLSFTFRINPDARWADGMPFTSDDFIATYNFLADTTLQQPFVNEFINTFEKPTAESKYIFTIKSKEKNWRQFYYITTLSLLPAHILKNMTAGEYNEKFQFKYLPGTGPYVILENDIRKGESITLRRRSDYWAENEKFNLGKYNFDEITLNALRDELLLFEKFKKGELDFFNIRKSEMWKDGFNFENAERNIILRKKVYNDVPLGYTGLAFNMREYPFNDIRIRKAFMHLYNRKMWNEKLFENSYSLYSSYFPNSEFANPNNPVVGYNYDSAMTLFNEAGWIANKDNGNLEKNGKQLEITLSFVKPMDQYLTIYQEDLQKAGIKLNLKETDFATIFKLGNDRNFTLIPINWTGLIIPNPVSHLSTETADTKNTNNWEGIKDVRIDSLCKLYDISYTKNEQVNILRTIDSIAHLYFPMIDGFYKPYRTFAYHNKFGYPDGLISRFDRYYSIFYYWYIDPEKYDKYQKALADNNLRLPKEELEENYWKKYNIK